MPRNPAKPTALDLTDHAAIRAWLADIETQTGDLAAIAEDQTAPMAVRRLGRAAAREQIAETQRALTQQLAFARRNLAR